MPEAMPAGAVQSDGFNLDSRAVWDRAVQLEEDEHLIEAVRRLMRPHRMMVGTKDAQSHAELLRSAAIGVAIQEARVLDGTLMPPPVVGVVTVTFNPASGYDLMLRAATVYALHLGKGGHKVVHP